MKRIKIFPSIIAILIFSLASIIYFHPILKGHKLNQSDITQFRGMVKDINDNVYRLPDENNPMMNINMYDLYDDKKAIPTYNNPGVKRKVEETLDGGIFKDSNDLFNRRNSQRQWYTMPNTEAMNKQTELGKWCYMTPPTCKEGNGLQCANNLHNRLNRNSGDACQGDCTA